MRNKAQFLSTDTLKHPILKYKLIAFSENLLPPNLSAAIAANASSFFYCCASRYYPGTPGQSELSDFASSTEN